MRHNEKFRDIRTSTSLVTTVLGSFSFLTDILKATCRLRIRAERSIVDRL